MIIATMNFHIPDFSRFSLLSRRTIHCQENISIYLGYGQKLFNRDKFHAVTPRMRIRTLSPSPGGFIVITGRLLPDAVPFFHPVFYDLFISPVGRGIVGPAF